MSGNPYMMAADVATNSGSVLYNIYAGERNFKYHKQQAELMRDREDNAVQRRVADLKAAGLHPTLAAGGPAAQAQPGMAAPPPPKEGKIGILESALMSQQVAQSKAQVMSTNAQAALTAAETDAVKRREDRADALAGIQHSAEGRNQELYEYNRTLRKMQERSLELSNIAASAGISKSSLERKILDARIQHIKDFGSDIGPADQWIKRINLGRKVQDALSDVFRSTATPKIYDGKVVKGSGFFLNFGDKK